MSLTSTNTWGDDEAQPGARARRDWGDPDNKALIDYWGRVGSIVLIAMLLDRTPSSVQTQASRIGLPRRAEVKDRHRRRWTEVERRLLDDTVKALTQSDGRFPIEDVALRLGRSVDAVAAQLAESFGGPANLLEKIVLPALPVPAPAPNGVAAQPVVIGANGRPMIGDDRKRGKMRNCLSCTKPFWSEGAHNRVCSKCKRDDGGWDWDS
jgi:hypothetical protein